MQEQEEISHNHVQRLNLISVGCWNSDLAYLYWVTFDLAKPSGQAGQAEQLSKDRKKFHPTMYKD